MSMLTVQKLRLFDYISKVQCGFGKHSPGTLTLHLHSFDFPPTGINLRVGQYYAIRPGLQSRNSIHLIDELSVFVGSSICS